jgi:CRISPR-associated protein Cas1
MLSYGYTILASEAVAAVESAGLDPDVGFLHSDRWGRPSLALDLMEEFRPVVVDSVVLGLVSRDRVTREDFSADERGSRMNQKARKQFVEAYEHRMLTEVADLHGHGQVSYREHLHRSALRLADALGSPDTVYHPFTWR